MMMDLPQTRLPLCCFTSGNDPNVSQRGFEKVMVGYLEENEWLHVPFLHWGEVFSGRNVSWSRERMSLRNAGCG